MVDLNERALAYRNGGLRDADDEGGAGGAGASRRRGQWDDEGGAGGRTRGGECSLSSKSFDMLSNYALVFSNVIRIRYKYSYRSGFLF